MHAGIGIRQLRPGYYEARVGLDLRVVFSRDSHGLVIELLGNHAAVRRYLRSL
ncbi:MAG: hypothetical protein HY736_06345 [Verrucomicrobia bacterium]|nr:hypothetical protein [Verrucomicrobiota bacterium]